MTNSGMELVHADERRTIHEMVYGPVAGPLTRVTRIDVMADGAVLGNHYHPVGDEHFVVQEGAGTLFLASTDNPNDVAKRTFRVGDSITVPANTIHTFVCQAGTVLVAVTDWLLTDAAVVQAKLV